MWPFPRCRGEKSVLQLFDVVDPAEYFLMLHSVLTFLEKVINWVQTLVF